MDRKAWAAGWGQGQLCPWGSSAVGLSLSHKDNQRWGRGFMSSSLSGHICKRGEIPKPAFAVAERWEGAGTTCWEAIPPGSS